LFLLPLSQIPNLTLWVGSPHDQMRFVVVCIYKHVAGSQAATITNSCHSDTVADATVAPEKKASRTMLRDFNPLIRLTKLRTQVPVAL
jgi:hypothetical protein